MTQAAETAKIQIDKRGQPPALRLRSICPTLTAGDIERSMAFYVEGLGFHVEERWEEDGKLLGVMLLAGASRIGLSQDDWAKGRDRKKGVGFHIYAETEQDLAQLAERARGKGLEVDGPKEQWGALAVSLVDPDGFKLTIANPMKKG
jgi:catechol-2,3-dioxygenase